MDAVEFLPKNTELRSHFLFFKQRADCTGITWSVQAADAVTAGQVIGRFTFATTGPVDILAPIDAKVLRTFTPNVADLPHRPSVTIALFHLG